jgi:hypothetical protein
MAAIPYATAGAFLRGESHHNGSFRSTRDRNTHITRLYSYAMLIATRTPSGMITWEIDPDNPPRNSATTSRHLRAAKLTLPDYTTNNAEANGY